MTVSQQIPAIVRSRGPDLAVLVKRIDGVPMLEALRLADEVGAVIASNQRLGHVMLGSTECNGIRCAIACWSGTLAAHVGPNRKIGKNIVFVDPKTEIKYVFPVPEVHQGKKNVVLLAVHPDFTLLKDEKDLVVQAAKIDAVDRFPASREGWYHGDPNHDLPQGEELNGNYPDARYFFRKEKMVGLVVRDNLSGARTFGLCYGPSALFGVIIEAAADAGEAKSEAEP